MKGYIKAVTEINKIENRKQQRTLPKLKKSFFKNSSKIAQLLANSIQHTKAENKITNNRNE